MLLHRCQLINCLVSARVDLLPVVNWFFSHGVEACTLFSLLFFFLYFFPFWGILGGIFEYCWSLRWIWCRWGDRDINIGDSIEILWRFLDDSLSAFVFCSHLSVEEKNQFHWRRNNNLLLSLLCYCQWFLFCIDPKITFQTNTTENWNKRRSAGESFRQQSCKHFASISLKMFQIQSKLKTDAAELGRLASMNEILAGIDTKSNNR